MIEVLLGSLHGLHDHKEIRRGKSGGSADANPKISNGCYRSGSDTFARILQIQILWRVRSHLRRRARFCAAQVLFSGNIFDPCFPVSLFSESLFTSLCPELCLFPRCDPLRRVPSKDEIAFEDYGLTSCSPLYDSLKHET